MLEVVEVPERPIARDDLARASEAFLASTTREVLPVRAIESWTYEAPGPRTREAAERLAERIRSELPA